MMKRIKVQHASLIGLLIGLVVVAVGSWYVFSKSGLYTPNGEFVSSIGKTSGRPVPEGALEYYSEQYRFSILYPEYLTVAEHDEGGGAMTITFERIESKTVEGFQLFIVPFAEAQITEERFRQDVPSGVRKDLKEITIDGAAGASFYSVDGVLGDTAEAWFVREGYLYEVSSFKERDTWLAEILSTWKFY